MNKPCPSLAQSKASRALPKSRTVQIRHHTVFEVSDPYAMRRDLNLEQILRQIEVPSPARIAFLLIPTLTGAANRSARKSTSYNQPGDLDTENSDYLLHEHQMATWSVDRLRPALGDYSSSILQSMNHRPSQKEHPDAFIHLDMQESIAATITEGLVAFMPHRRTYS